MSIGIIGSGALGSNVARAFARKGIAAMISNSREPATLAPLVKEIGPSIKAVHTQEAAAACGGRLRQDLASLLTR
ncbi:MAG TPA: NAD(P)-binding domain-containing protein [Burkholderiaceae bacterium]|nr:NAD(P)-binding domain-containing protein [Burkholderiaceae bacterium]